MAYEWPGVRVLKLPETDRVKRLSALRSFYEGEQHAHKKLDFAGRSRKLGHRYVIERLLDAGFEPVHKPAIASRKPDAPVSLGRQVVQGFDEMIYPRGLAPTLETPADPRTGRYLREVFQRSLTWATLLAARTIAGACGEAAVRVFVDEHRPKSEAIDTRETFVREWADKGEHIPAVVVWQRLVEIEEEDEESGELLCRKVWRTRIFDETHEYLYEDVAEDYGEKRDKNKTRADGETPETGWIPLATREVVDDDGKVVGVEPHKVEHKVGRCPIVWIQNTRCTTDPSGEPDCEGAHELMDKVDLVTSMSCRTTVSNLDPTLCVSDTNQWHNKNKWYAKGWGEVIRLSQEGKAALLETSGATVEMGWKTYRELKTAVLQTTRAVIIDPEVAGKYAQSGVALSMLWRPMEGAAGRKRVPQEAAIEQLAAMWVALGVALGVASTEDEAPKGIVLPPVKVPVDAAEGLARVTGAAEGEDDTEVLVVHAVGKAKYVQILWPPFHETSAEGFSAAASAVKTLVGDKPVLSQRTGVMLSQRAAGIPVDVDAEMERLEMEAAEAMERQRAFVEGPEGQPPGASEDDEDDEEPEDDIDEDPEDEDDEDDDA